MRFGFDHSEPLTRQWQPNAKEENKDRAEKIDEQVTHQADDDDAGPWMLSFETSKLGLIVGHVDKDSESSGHSSDAKHHLHRVENSERGKSTRIKHFGKE